MNTPQTIPELVTRIEHAMQRVTRVIDTLSPAQMQEPRLTEGRSVKDLLGHLTWWDQWLLVTPPRPPECIGQPPYLALGRPNSAG